MIFALSDDQKSLLQVKQEKTVAPNSPYMKKMSDESDMMKAARLIISVMKESIGSDREILSSIKDLVEVQKNPQELPKTDKVPEKWEFDIQRDKEGRASKIIAKQIQG